MKRLAIFLFLLLAAPALYAQDYEVPEVVVSTEKANIAGKLYYVHKVLPKQTQFSICKAYGVTEEELVAANPDLKDGLKAGSILFIPIKESVKTPEAQKTVETRADNADVAEAKEDEELQTVGDGNGRQIERVIEHEVRWFESIQSIARKYKVKADDILAYNGLGRAESLRGKTLLIPIYRTDADIAEVEKTDGTDTPEVSETPDQPDDPMTPVRRVRWFSAADPIRIALVLPFQATTKASTQFLNFYSGALMAVQEQKEKGAHVVLNVYDLEQGSSAIIDDPRFRESDIVIGLSLIHI